MSAMTGVPMNLHALVETMVLTWKLASKVALLRVSLTASHAAQASSHQRLRFDWPCLYISDLTFDEDPGRLLDIY
jgi:hypothetical protein